MTAVALAATPSRTRIGWIMPALAATLAAVGVWWAVVPYLVGVFHDDGIYVLLARSIAEGQGFHYSHLPGAPAATHYPPLYPLALAAVWKLVPAFPANVGALLRLNVLFAGLAAAGWWAFATKRLAWNDAGALVSAVAVAMSTPMLTLSSALLSETMFIALVWPVLIFAERAVTERATRTLALLGVATGALMLVRTHAIALLAAIILLLLVDRRLRDALVVAASATAIQLPWFIWTAIAAPHVAAPLEGSYGSYAGWFFTGVREGGASFLLGTVRANTREIAQLLRDRFTTGFSPAFDTCVALLVVVFLAYGATQFAHRARVTLGFCIGYVIIVLVWPYSPWRFMYAMWPVFALLILEGVRVAWSHSARLRPVIALGATAALLAFLRTELHSYATRGWRAPSRQATAQLAPMLRWIEANTTSGDIVLTEGEQVVALYAGRKAAPPVAFTAREYLVRRDSAEATIALQAMLRAVPAQYVVTLSPDVQRSAFALRELRPLPSGNGLAAFQVQR